MRFMKNAKSKVKYFRLFVYVNLNCPVEMCSDKCNTIARDKNGGSRDIIILDFHGKPGAIKLRKLSKESVVFDIGYHTPYAIS